MTRIAFLVDSATHVDYASFQLIKSSLDLPGISQVMLFSLPEVQYCQPSKQSANFTLDPYHPKNLSSILLKCIVSIESRSLSKHFSPFQLFVPLHKLGLSKKTINTHFIDSICCGELAFVPSFADHLHASSIDILVNLSSYRIAHPSHLFVSTLVVIDLFSCSYTSLPRWLLPFRDVLNRNPTVCSTISVSQKGHTRFFTCQLMNSEYWLLSYCRTQLKVNRFILNSILSAYNPDYYIKEYSISPPVQLPVQSTISLFSILKYVCFVIIPLIFQSLALKLHLISKPHWQIAYFTRTTSDHSFSKIFKVKAPRGHYYADPFPITRDGKNYIFVEDYCFKSKKGCISAIQLSADNRAIKKCYPRIINEDFHLSFPYIFRYNCDYYMVPESNEAKQIRLYKALDFPSRWQLHRVLMSNISAADSVLIYKDATWFLLTNICSADLSDYNSELHIFFADSLDSPIWQPITSGNPVLCNSLRARNGGCFFYANSYYRVNQIHQQAHYGYAFSVNKILMLSRDSYKEETIQTIFPSSILSSTSTHTFNLSSLLGTIDFQ